MSSSWIENYKALVARLSPEQANVVVALRDGYGTERRPLRVIAAAGSGKTGVMVTAVGFLLNEKIANPRDIVVTTFTKKAQTEIRSRLEAVTAPGTIGPGGVRVATYHALALSAVTRAQKTASYLQRPHQWSQAMNLDLHGKERAKERPPSTVTEFAHSAVKWINLPDLWEQIAVTGHIPGLEDHIPSVVGHTKVSLDPKELARRVEVFRSAGHAAPESAVEAGLLSPTESEDDAAVVYGWKLFCMVKKNLQAWDFGDILQAYYDYTAQGGDKARLFVVDESQDNSALQMSIARNIAYNDPVGRVCYVGDLRQSVYRFRGAEPDILGKLDQREAAFTQELTVNYRSTPAIIAIGNAIAHQQDWSVGSPAQPHRADPGGAGSVRYMRCTSDMTRARTIAGEIKQKIADDSTITPANFAVLCRTRAAMAPFEVSFLLAEVPAKIQGGSSFFKNKAIKRVMGYIRMAAGVHGAVFAPDILRDDFRAMVRDRGIIARTQSIDDVWRNSGAAANPKYTLEMLTQWYDREVSLKAFGKAGKKRELLWGRDQARRERSFDALLGSLELLVRAPVAPEGADPKVVGAELSELIWSLAEDMAKGGLLTLKPPPKGRNGEEIVGEGDLDIDMICALREVAAELPSLMALAELSIRAGGLAELAAEAYGNGEEEGAKVTVGTIHSVKGGEFPTVYLLTGKNELPHRGLDLPEERRIFYVGATRAKDHLILASNADGESVYVKTVHQLVHPGLPVPGELDYGSGVGESPDMDAEPCPSCGSTQRRIGGGGYQDMRCAACDFMYSTAVELLAPLPPLFFTPSEAP